MVLETFGSPKGSLNLVILQCIVYNFFENPRNFNKVYKKIIDHPRCHSIHSTVSEISADISEGFSFRVMSCRHIIHLRNNIILGTFTNI